MQVYQRVKVGIQHQKEEFNGFDLSEMDKNGMIADSWGI